MFTVVLYQPEIPPNTGNVIRLCANTGADLHLVKPLGFPLDSSKMKRAGLDYHEFASLTVHENFADCLSALSGCRIFALTTKGSTRPDQVSFRPGDPAGRRFSVRSGNPRPACRNPRQPSGGAKNPPADESGQQKHEFVEHSGRRRFRSVAAKRFFRRPISCHTDRPSEKQAVKEFAAANLINSGTGFSFDSNQTKLIRRPGCRLLTQRLRLSCRRHFGSSRRHCSAGRGR